MILLDTINIWLFRDVEYYLILQTFYSLISDVQATNFE